MGFKPDAYFHVTPRARSEHGESECVSVVLLAVGHPLEEAQRPPQDSQEETAPQFHDVFTKQSPQEPLALGEATQLRVCVECVCVCVCMCVCTFACIRVHLMCVCVQDFLHPVQRDHDRGWTEPEGMQKAQGGTTIEAVHAILGG
jgi:hypothetical protein